MIKAFRDVSVFISSFITDLRGLKGVLHLGEHASDSRPKNAPVSQQMLSTVVHLCDSHHGAQKTPTDISQRRVCQN